MAEPGSRSSRPLQGIILLVLLLASTQAAVPVEQALEGLEAGLSVLRGAVKKEWKKPLKAFKAGYKGGKAWGNYQNSKQKDEQQYPGGGPTTYVDTVVVYISAAGIPRSLPVATADITATAAVREGFFCAPGVLAGRLLDCSVTLLGRGGTLRQGVLAGRLLDCSSGGDARAVLGLGRGGELSTRFPKFSYIVGEDLHIATALVLPPPAPLQVVGTVPLYSKPIHPNLYYVAISGIRFGSQPTILELMMQLSLSTTETYTYLESGAYVQFKTALMAQIQALNPRVRPAPSRRFPADELCYVSKDLMVLPPPLTILFAGGNNAAMDLTFDKVWYVVEPEQQGPPTVCMAILPATLSPGGVPILGTWLQRGRTMTVDLTTSAQAGTLTFF